MAGKFLFVMAGYVWQSDLLKNLRFRYCLVEDFAMRFIDTYDSIVHCFPPGEFSLQDWANYAGRVSPHLGNKVREDVSAYDFDADILPVVTAALRDRERLYQVHKAFQAVAETLRVGLIEAFGVDLDVEIILYLGLCSGAGWATSLGEQKVILLGIEKIIELGWCDERKLFALIAHEIGHIWHMEAGGLYDRQRSGREAAVFQLYSEGVAMWCEQKLCNAENYYHQDGDGWLEWCENNLAGIKKEYLQRLRDEVNVQDFFGDWCSYQGYSDVGYYLGCQEASSRQIHPAPNGHSDG
jgi:hypothetical protein